MCSVSPRLSASSIRARACAEVSVIGFSSQTCLPALSAAIASGKCVATGVAIATASTSGSLISAIASVVTLAAGNRRDTVSSACGLRSATM
jgi:hypothetical protein